MSTTPREIGYSEPHWARGSDTVPQQIAERLARQRKQNVPFSTAWRQTVGRNPRVCNLKLPSDMRDRNGWRELFESPEYVEVWAAAYERRPMRALDAVEALHYVLERADEAA